MPHQIELYEEMSALSAQMVDAARAQEWDRLIDLEKRVAELREMLMAENPATPLSPAEIEVKRVLIQRILDDDAEIRRHTEPWMEKVRRLLGDTTRRQQVERAYGASSTM
jgi:flagellar protein FliT